MTDKVIQLKGSTMAYGGRLRQDIVDMDFEKLLIEGGGHFNKIASGTTFFVDGFSSGSKKTKALTRGITVISQDEFVTLLTDGRVTIQTRKTIERDLQIDDVLGELRGILAAPASPDAWSNMLHHVERCDEAQLPALVNYLKPQVALWGKGIPWAGKKTDPIFDTFYPKYWLKSMPESQLCIAPPVWMLDVLRGDRSVRHQLAVGLNFEGMKLNGELATQLIHYDGWGEVRALNLGIQNLYPRSFYDTLASSPMALHLEELWMNEHPKVLAGVGLDAFPSLKLLRCHFPKIRYRYDTSDTALERMRVESGWISPDVTLKLMDY